MTLTETLGYICAVFGIFFYVLFEFYSTTFLCVISAIYLLVAVFLLLVSALATRQQNQAWQRYKNFEKLKKRLTDEYEESKRNEKTDSRTEDEKSQGDAGLK